MPAGAESFVNPGKTLALDLAGSIPVLWGSSPMATVAARRFADTLAANARYPASPAAWARPAGAGSACSTASTAALSEADRDIFADPADSDDGPDCGYAWSCSATVDC